MTNFNVILGTSNNAAAWGEDTTQLTTRTIEAETPNEAFWKMLDDIQGMSVWIEKIEGFKLEMLEAGDPRCGEADTLPNGKGIWHKK